MAGDQAREAAVRLTLRAELPARPMAVDQQLRELLPTAAAVTPELPPREGLRARSAIVQVVRPVGAAQARGAGRPAAEAMAGFRATAVGSVNQARPAPRRAAAMG
jgi:hypothetical protein